MAELLHVLLTTLLGLYHWVDDGCTQLLFDYDMKWYRFTPVMEPPAPESIKEACALMPGFLKQLVLCGSAVWARTALSHFNLQLEFQDETHASVDMGGTVRGIPSMLIKVKNEGSTLRNPQRSLKVSRFLHATIRHTKLSPSPACLRPKLPVYVWC
ncbi:hypothetical protein B0O99DRAFT_110104 [Bisporella sp. PMI_857]|nr:hypothetical protein B0O99DRAFT_110104 [Bisporella sp. PMI_857]